MILWRVPQQRTAAIRNISVLRSPSPFILPAKSDYSGKFGVAVFKLMSLCGRNRPNPVLCHLLVGCQAIAQVLMVRCCSEIRNASSYMIVPMSLVRTCFSDNAKDAFVHISAVQRSGLEGLYENDKVSYELETGRDGKESATKLKLLS